MSSTDESRDVARRHQDVGLVVGLVHVEVEQIEFAVLPCERAGQVALDQRDARIRNAYARPEDVEQDRHVESVQVVLNCRLPRSQPLANHHIGAVLRKKTRLNHSSFDLKSRSVAYHLWHQIEADAEPKIRARVRCSDVKVGLLASIDPFYEDIEDI